MGDKNFIEREKQDSEKYREDGDMEKFKLYLTEVKTLVLAYEGNRASDLD